MISRSRLYCSKPGQSAGAPVDWAAKAAEANATPDIDTGELDDRGRPVYDTSARDAAVAAHVAERGSEGRHLVRHVGPLLVDGKAFLGKVAIEGEGPEDPEGRGGVPIVCAVTEKPIQCPVCLSRVYLLPEE